jgi:hypothetical protein
MANSFQALKKSTQTSFTKLTDELTKLSATPQGKQEDARFWKPTVDKAGNGFAVIRFLPAPEGEDVPFVRIFDHAFQGPGGWYIEKSLTSLGEKDPVSEYNMELWNTGLKSNQDIVRKQKRKLGFISNVYIVKDTANPENEGKVFMYKYGKKIFDKLNAAMNPEFEDENPLNPFDMWEGANFKLKIRKVEGYQNYDKSEFDEAGPLLQDDDQLESIWKSEYALQPFLARAEFKDYDVLKARLYKVLGLDGSSSKPVVRATEVDLLEETLEPTPKAKAAPRPAAANLAEDDDESMSFFQKLAED